jgi:hypothetical protein
MVDLMFLHPDRLSKPGVMTALIEGAVETTRTADARAIEAYRLDAAVTFSSSWTGLASTFFRQDFRELRGTNRLAPFFGDAALADAYRPGYHRTPTSKVG